MSSKSKSHGVFYFIPIIFLIIFIIDCKVPVGVFSYPLWYPVICDVNFDVILLSVSYPIKYFASVSLLLPYANASGTTIFSISVSNTSILSLDL